MCSRHTQPYYPLVDKAQAEDREMIIRELRLAGGREAVTNAPTLLYSLLHHAGINEGGRNLLRVA